MPTITCRTDARVKKDAQKVLQTLGLDLSSAINLYLRQIVITKSIPFRIRTVNGFLPATERQMLQEEAEALRSGKRYASARELFRDILGEN